MGEEAAGYDCKFVEAPPAEIETECPICLLVLRQPSQVECCGRVFCTACLRRALRDGSNSCPMCYAQGPRVFTDQNFRRILAGFRVYCVHRSRGEGEEGCEWTGELGQLSNHLDQVCQFLTVECSLCGAAMKRSSFPNHQEQYCPKRSYSCPHCKLQSNYENITNNHLAECPCFPSQCPHCEIIFERCELHLHLDNDCILVPTPCLFRPVGCQENLLRLELATHLKSSVMTHANLLLEARNGDWGEKMVLYKTALEGMCQENSELSSKVAAFTVQHEMDEKRINRLQTFQLALCLLVGVLFLVAVVLYTNK